MAIFAHEIGDMRACTGKPAELGGIPHELGTTGYRVTSGLEAAIEVLEELKSLHISKNKSEFQYKALEMLAHLPPNSQIHLESKWLP